MASLNRPVAELPGLVLAIDGLRGPVIRLILAAEGWRPVAVPTNE